MAARIALASLMAKQRGARFCIHLQPRRRNRGSTSSGNYHPLAEAKPSRWRPRSILTVAALLVFGGALRSFALDPAKTVYQYNCQTWTRREGLPANSINAITQTRDGYLWLGTSKGLVRFDGLEFKAFSLPDHIQFRSQVISSLSSSKDGGLWFGISVGSFGYCDGQSIFPVKNVGWVDRSMDVRSIQEDRQGVVWVAAQTGMGRLVNPPAGETSFIGELNDGMTAYNDSRGRVWVGTVRHGLYYWQDGKVRAFPDDSLKENIIFAVAEDLSGQIWVGTENGLRCYGSDFRRKEMGDSFGDIRCLLVDRNGVLWMGTSANGLVCYKDGRFASLKKGEGLANNSVTALWEDREGSLWIGTSDGLSQLTDLKLPIYSSTEGLIGGSAHAVCASQKGGLWVAISGGISWLDGRRVRNYTAEQGLPNPYIKRVFEAKNGDIYLTDGDLAVEILAGDKIVTRHTNSAMPVALAEDAQGVVVSVVSNLFRVSRDQFAPYAFKHGQEPLFAWIYNLAPGRDGSLWVATVNGIFRVKDGTWQQWSVAEGLSWSKVHWVFEDSDGTVWAGLPTGMARLKENRIRNITRADGLFDDFIFAIVPDDLGYFWVDSMRGFFRVRRQSLNDFCDGKISRVQCEAYAGLETVKTIDKTDQEWSGCKTRDGRIWFPSSQGAVMIDPANLQANPTPPLVYIRRVYANGIELTNRPVSVARPGKGNLEFQYTALSYVAPQKVRFQCQLEGYDRDWIESGTRRSAFYTNLKPGKYRFRVIACNADGVWSPVGDSFAVELQPHIYQTLWFYLAGAGLGVAGLWGIYTWRIGRLRQRHLAMLAAQNLLEAKVEARTIELEAQKQQLKNEMEERKKLEEQLVQSQKMDAIGRLAGGIAHDFNNILTIIQGYAQILNTRENLDPEMIEELKQIIQAAHRASNLTRQLLTFSRKQVIQSAVLDLNKVTGNLAKMLQRIIGEDILLQCHFFPNPLLVQADEDMIGQILMNLAVNARDAMPGGGRLAVTLSTLRLDAAAATGRSPGARAGEFVCLNVSDTGCGISPENLPRIFEPFFTTKTVEQGTGLGLSTVYGIVKQHGGWIEVSSKLQTGTKFDIFLPRISAGTVAETGARKAKAVGGTETILLVEDEPPVRQLARTILQKHGYQVIEAASGVDALSVWGQHAAKIDLLLTDIIMPQGISGRELAHRLRAERSGLKVVFVSGYSPDSMEIGAELNATTLFLQKPYVPEQLLRSLRQILDNHGS
jgi:signal transduction histidine kinase/ligand-binding sensor domain-containing protein/CheY-like chemotaxis protein